MRMTSVLAAAAALSLGLALSACSTVRTGLDVLTIAAGFEVTQAQVDAAHAAYTTGFLPWASGYRTLYDRAPCAPGTHASLSYICAERDVVLKLQATDRTVKQSLDLVEAGVRSCAVDKTSAGCVGLPAAYRALTNVVDAAKQLAATYSFR